MVLVMDKIGKIEIESIRIAVARTELLFVLIGRHIPVIDNLILICILMRIISSDSIESIIHLAEILETAFDLEADEVSYLPVECSVGVP